MPVYELGFNDFLSIEYSLLAVYTILEDYKLAYLLNKQLNYSFKKSDFNLDKNNKNDVKASFSVYEYSNTEYDFFLIKNTFKNNTTTNGVSLFAESYFVDYLVPERKKVDYFLKIEGDIPSDYLSNLMVKLKQLPQVQTSYEIDINLLKSKDFLIF